MYMIPKDIIQFNIHEITVIRLDTLRFSGEDTYYMPLIRYSYVLEGEDHAKEEQAETVRADIYKGPEIYNRPDDILPVLARCLDELLDRGVIVVIEPELASYTPDNVRGRIHSGIEVAGKFYQAMAGIRTFADIWARNEIEYVVAFEDSDGDYLEYTWMEESDDLLEMIAEMILPSSETTFLDIQPMRGPKEHVSPDNPIKYRRVVLNSFFVLSFFNEIKNRKTYFSSICKKASDETKFEISCSSTVRGAYHFKDEESALKFALKYSDFFLS